MFFFRCSWLARNAVGWARSLRPPRRKRPRPPAAPLRVERLEDRLAPAAPAPFPPVVIADPGPSSVPPNVPSLQPNTTVTGTIQQLPQTDRYALLLPASGQLTILALADSGGTSVPHITLRESDGQLILDSSNGTATVILLQPSGAETYLLTIEGEATGPYQVSVPFTPLMAGADGPDSAGGQAPDPDAGPGAGAGPGNHHFLSALAATVADGPDFRSLGDGTLRSFLGGLGGNSPSLAVALEQRVVSTTTMVVRSDAVDRGNSVFAAPLGGASRADPAGLPSRLPLPGELPGFSAFSPSVLMTPAKDRAPAFELSALSPAGPDIVPIPVPRGLEDWLAELLGGPAQGPDGRAAADGDAGGTSLRDAVFQMLQQGWAPPGQAGGVPANVPQSTSAPFLPPPPKGVPAGATGAPVKTGALPNAAALPSEEETGGPAVEPSAASMLAAFAVGLGQAGWRPRRRDERPRRG